LTITPSSCTYGVTVGHNNVCLLLYLCECYKIQHLLIICCTYKHCCCSLVFCCVARSVWHVVR